MSYNVLTLIIGWLIALILFLGFIALLRYIQYRERMAMLTHGMRPEDLPRRRHNSGILRAGLITGMVGLSLTIGLYPLGFLLPTTFTATPFHLGPWLLPGLIPFGVGVALVTSAYLEQSSGDSKDKTETDKKKENNIISMHERPRKEDK
jgi:hypothetical protein